MSLNGVKESTQRDVNYISGSLPIEDGKINRTKKNMMVAIK